MRSQAFYDDGESSGGFLRGCPSTGGSGGKLLIGLDVVLSSFRSPYGRTKSRI